jgi:hypothetical protein
MGAPQAFRLRLSNVTRGERVQHSSGSSSIAWSTRIADCSSWSSPAQVANWSAVRLPQHADEHRPEHLSSSQSISNSAVVSASGCPRPDPFAPPDTLYAATPSSWLVQFGQRVASKAMSVLQYGHGLLIASLGPAIRLYALMTMNITNATMRKETRAFRNLP